MKTMVVAVGSTNLSKVRAVERAYAMLGFNIVVRAVKPNIDLPRQPIGLEELYNGAVRRAEAALSAVDDAEEAVGIEAGVFKDLGGRYINIPVAAIVDRGGYLTIGVGPGFEIPRSFGSELDLGRELEEVVDERFGRASTGELEGFVGILTKSIITRIDLNTGAVLMALIPRLPWNRSLYTP